MASLSDILTAVQNGVVALNDLGRQVTGSFNNISSQLAKVGGGGYSNIIAYVTGASSMTITADAVALFDSSGKMVGATSVYNTPNAAGVGANGVDTGSITTGGYYYFLIYNPTTDTLSSLISLSATAPTMPPGYTYKRRIGWFYYNGGITNFTQRNANFAYAVPRVLVTGVATSAFSLVGFVPATASLVRGLMVTNNNTVYVADNVGNTILSIGPAPNGACTWSWEFVMQNGAVQMSYSSSSSGGQASITGWEDNI